MQDQRWFGYTSVVATKKKNPAAVQLGKLRIASMSEGEHHEISQKGGLKGGKARAKKLTPEQRSAIAKKAAEAKWAAKRKAAK